MVGMNSCTSIIQGEETKNQESGLAYWLAMDLVRLFTSEPLFVDNYHTHLKLFLGLEKQNTFKCGRIESNHGPFPDQFKNAKLSTGECIYLNSPLDTGSLLVVHWYGKWDLFALSSIRGTGGIEVSFI